MDIFGPKKYRFCVQGWDIIQDNWDIVQIIMISGLFNKHNKQVLTAKNSFTFIIAAREMLI